MRIALVGTRGVPARYGGFETAVEEVGRRLVLAGHDVVVYCRGAQGTPAQHLGMRLVHLPALHMKAVETLSHTGLSALHLARTPTDVAIVFNAANAPFLPVLRSAGIPTALHVDGLEWKRGKWGKVGRSYYMAAERLAVRWADELIADAWAIADYYADRYGATAAFIPYGAPILRDVGANRVSTVGVEPRRYHLVVARFEPENNVEMIVDGYARSAAQQPLVVVGDAPYGKGYVDRIHAVAAKDSRVRLLGSVWDQALLDELYANTTNYLHGHSVGGTNPSLLRAMGAAAPVTAIDVPFTREVLGPTAWFFRQPGDVTRMVEAAERAPHDALFRGTRAQARAAEYYDWDSVAADYEALCFRLYERKLERELGTPFQPLEPEIINLAELERVIDGSLVKERVS